MLVEGRHISGDSQGIRMGFHGTLYELIWINVEPAIVCNGFVQELVIASKFALGPEIYRLQRNPYKATEQTILG